ncbi:MAG: cytochrome c oxidase subunit 3 [Flavobacteriaceae bacterium]|nr:cytochrome c oxidase subunit 3 [Flavobacteriaceae bacterium]
MLERTELEKQQRAKKMMLWFGIISLVMGFAGWTSAYIVSSKRKDWVASIELPQAFWWSTAVIGLSSLTYILARLALKADKLNLSSRWAFITLLLGVSFVFIQFNGFNQMVAAGYYFTGPTSSIKMSYIFLIAFVHLLHLFAGLISLGLVNYKLIRSKYSSENILGFELGETFWHFLGVLWIYLVLFMFFVK